jgi:hypothetical protein
MSSRRDFFRSMLARSTAGVPGLPGDEAERPRERPAEPVEATPERAARAFSIAPDQRDIAYTLARQGFLELLPDERFCTARDFVARSVRSPLPPSVAGWLSRTQGRSAPDPTRAVDAALLARVREDLAGTEAPPRRSGS